MYRCMSAGVDLVPPFEHCLRYELARGNQKMTQNPGKPGYKPSALTRVKGVLQRAAGRGRRLATSKSARTDGAEAWVRPENVVWIFGSGRTGSTWLSAR